MIVLIQEADMNILEIIIIIMTVLFAATGYYIGFVRKLASLLSLVISIILVSVCLPYVTNFLKNSTPVYDMIVKQCQEVVESQVAGVLDSGSAANGALDAYRSMGREEIKALMEQEGYDSSVVDSLSDEQLENYREQFIQQYAARYLSGNQSADGGTDSVTQNEMIRNLPLPKVLRDQLLANNTDEGYRRLGVSTFLDYIVHFSATVILNVISFVVALLLVQIALRLAIAALDVLSRAPVIGWMNRVAGLLLGLLQMLFLLWLFFMVISALSATETGLYLMSMVQESRLLSWLYDSNLFMRIVLQAAGMFL